MADRDRDVRQLEENIERTRAEIAETVGSIEQRLAPETIVSEIFDGAADYLRGPGGQRIIDAILRNPVPFVLTALGVGWLAMDIARERRLMSVDLGYAPGEAGVYPREPSVRPGPGVRVYPIPPEV